VLTSIIFVRRSFVRRAPIGWCGRGDLNPHDFHRWNLNPVRLPIPPRPLLGDFIRALARANGGAF
jgi:hypothetical protein